MELICAACRTTWDDAETLGEWICPKCGGIFVYDYDEIEEEISNGPYDDEDEIDDDDEWG